jgi:hypothetical protein
MTGFRGKCARLLALLAVLAGLLGAAMPGLAAPTAPKPATHAAMDCDHGARHEAPRPHLPPGDCCVANVCAMSLALLAAPSGLVTPVFPQRQDYELRPLLPPAGIITAPIPHPPKSNA